MDKDPSLKPAGRDYGEIFAQVGTITAIVVVVGGFFATLIYGAREESERALAAKNPTPIQTPVERISDREVLTNIGISIPTPTLTPLGR